MILESIGIIFAVFALSRVFLRYRDKSISLYELLFWSVVWVGLVVVAIFPSIFTRLSLVLGIGRGVDIILYIGMILLFYLTFRLYVKIENHQKDITKIVRDLALHKKQFQKKEHNK